jgi:hypothetical protein
MLLLCPVASWAEDAKTTVSGSQGDRPIKFAGGLGTYYEGLVVALLGNCTSESGDRVATNENWKKVLKGDHVRVQFAEPRKFGVTGEREVEADEILVPISASRSPDHIFVRTGNTYRAFAKYDHKTCSFIQESLKALANR